MKGAMHLVKEARNCCKLLENALETKIAELKSELESASTQHRARKRQQLALYGQSLKKAKRFERTPVREIMQIWIVQEIVFLIPGIPQR